MADDPYSQYADPYAQYAQKPAEQQQAPLSFSDYAKTLGSQFIRPIANAVSGLPLMIADAGVQARALIEHPHLPHSWSELNPFSEAGRASGGYELPSDTYRKVLDTYTQAPTTTGGKIGEFVNSVAAGGALSGVLPQPSAQIRATDQILPKVKPVAPLTAGQQRAADAGTALGMKLTPGQASGNEALQQFEAKLQAQPWTSGPFNAIGKSNQQVLNSAWGRAIGQGGEKAVDSAVLENANDALGSAFDNARSPNSVLVTNPEATTAAISKVADDFEGLTNTPIAQHPLVQKLQSIVDSGSATGEQLGNLSSKIGKAAANQMTSGSGDRQAGLALFDIKNHVDDLLQSTLTGQEAASYAAARSQYRSMMQLLGRVGNVNTATGNVGGGSLANYLQQTDRPGYVFGRNQSDAYNATRFSQAFKPIVGNSGTATRSAPTLKELALAIPGSLFSRAYLSNTGQRLVTGAQNLPQIDPALGVLNSIPQAGLAGMGR